MIGNDQLNRIKNLKKHIFVSLTTKTELKMNKKSRETKEINPHNKIYKYKEQVCGIGFLYNISVNNRLKKEGKEDNFISQQLPWGEWVENSKTLIQYKGNLYLRCMINFTNNKNKIWYKDENDNEIKYEDLIEYLPPENPNNHQGLDNPIKVVNYKIDNIIKIQAQNII